MLQRASMLPRLTDAGLAKTQAWIRERGIFDAQTSVVDYANAVAS